MEHKTVSFCSTCGDGSTEHLFRHIRTPIDVPIVGGVYQIDLNKFEGSISGKYKCATCGSIEACHVDKEHYTHEFKASEGYKTVTLNMYVFICGVCEYTLEAHHDKRHKFELHIVTLNKREQDVLKVNYDKKFDIGLLIY